MMLGSFSVGNYLSFRDKQILEMSPDPLKEYPEHLHIPYLYDINTKLLKSVGIYGHNSHGKSNFIKAYQFFQNFVLTSFSYGKTEELIQIDNFKLNTATQDQPSFFEIVFFLGDKKYRYGFEVTSRRIVSEWLFYAEAKIRENYLFIRKDQEFKTSKAWNKENENRIDQALIFTKPPNLLLSVLLSQDNISHSDSISKWIKSNIIIFDINDEIHLKRAAIALSDMQYRGIINNFIEQADLGFTSVIEKLDSFTTKKLSLSKEFLNFLYADEIQRYELYTKHTIYDETYKSVNTVLFELLKNESAGSIKFLIISCYLSFAIKRGQLIFIDEIDSKFHPLLLELLVKTYNDGNVNVLGSQMIFTSHNTVLLDNKLRRDQIAFIEKNKYGESRIFKMHTAKRPIRIDTSIEKEYRKGKLGGTSKIISPNANQSTLDFGE